MTIFSKHNQLIFSALASLFVLSSLPSCQREPSPVDENLYLTDEPILIQAAGSDVQTRGLLNKADLPTVDSKVKVYDYLTGFSGVIDGQEYTKGNVMYIDDEVECVTPGSETNPEGEWNFASGHNWRWTRTGTHNFFGWLKEDKDGLTPASLLSNWNPEIDANNKLTIPSIALKSSSAQFDFSYSDKVSVASTDVNKNTTVTIPLNHLFSALALTIQNIGEDKVTIKSLTLEGIKNAKNAEVDYAGASPVVRYHSETWSTQLLADMSDKELVQNTKLDLYTGAVVSSTSNYILMWPQTADELENAKFVFKYTMDGVYSTEPGHEDELQVITREISFNETGRFTDSAGHKLGLDAGKKYGINILFKGKTIELDLVVMPWDYQTFDVDYSSSSISANNANGVPNEGVMWLYTWGYNTTHNVYEWNPGDRETRTVTMESGQNVRGIFYIGTPHSGRWQLTMYPAEAAHYFIVEPSSGQITEDMIKNNKGLVEFLVKPNGPVPSQQTVHFNLSFQFNGESQWRDGNSEFNRKDWKIVREP